MKADKLSASIRGVKNEFLYRYKYISKHKNTCRACRYGLECNKFLNLQKELNIFLERSKRINAL